MVRLIIVLQLIIGTFTGLNSVRASEAIGGRELAKKNLCLGCHSETKKVVGPALKQEAKRYDNSPASNKYLSTRIKEGGVGAWGAIPMPANKNNITDNEVNEVIQWIFSLNRQKPS